MCKQLSAEGCNLSPFFSPIPGRVPGVLCLLLWIFILFSGCISEDTGVDEPEETKKPVKLVYVDWASEKASSNVIKAVIQKKLNRECELLPVSLGAMWESVAQGDQDGMVAAWLPSLQAAFLQAYGPQMEFLGANLDGTRSGLVVPAYVEIDSIAQLSRHREKFHTRIIGIDPQAGIMAKTEEAMAKYGLGGFELISGSGRTMTAALGNAVEEGDWIVVTGWTPHWKFAKWDLRYLQDPLGVYGGKEYIGTFARRGLAEDMPDVYALLKNFKWRPKDMEQVMLYVQDENTTYFQAALHWIRENDSLVSDWLEQ